MRSSADGRTSQSARLYEYRADVGSESNGFVVQAIPLRPHLADLSATRQMRQWAAAAKSANGVPSTCLAADGTHGVTLKDRRDSAVTKAFACGWASTASPGGDPAFSVRALPWAGP